MKTLTAGAAKACITPPAELMPAYSFLPIKLEKVFKDIYVRTLYLDNGERRMLFVVIESGDLGRVDELYSALGSRLGLKKSEILLTVTHTHEAPTFAEYHDNVKNDPQKLEWVMKYGDFVIEQTVACAQSAVSGAVGVKWGYATGTSYININRDQQFEDGTYGVGFNPQGPSDKTLFVMKLVDAGGRTVALLINYAVHGTACFMAKDENGEQYMISGDLPGMISEYVEERFEAEHTVAVWTSGAAGNQVPVFMPTYEEFGHDLTHQTGVNTGYAAWGLCRHLGQLQGMDVIRLAAGITELRDTMEIRTVDRVLALPSEKDPEGSPVALVLKLVVLNDLAILGVGGELVCEIGLKLKEQAPLKTMIIINHIAQRIQYLPDKTGYLRKTFEGQNTRVRGGCTEDYLLPEVGRMFDERFYEPAK